MPIRDLSDDVVLLTPPTAADVDVITAICQDPQIAAWTTVPHPYLREHAEGFISDLVTPGWESGTDLTWAIHDPSGLVGMVGLAGVADGSAEAGYWLAPAARGRGLLTRALRLVLGAAFDPGGPELVRVSWQAYVGNWPSRRAAWRVGFRVEGTIRLHAVQREGIRRDSWVGTILAGDPREPNEPWPHDAPVPLTVAPGPVP